MAGFWTPPTLEDALAAEAGPQAAGLTVAGGFAPAATDGPVEAMAPGLVPAGALITPSSMVRCGCGRLCPPFEMVDVRRLPSELRGNREYMCSGCRARLVLTGAVTFPDLLEMLGAPADFVEYHRGVERERAMRGKQDQSGEPISGPPAKTP